MTRITQHQFKSYPWGAEVLFRKPSVPRTTSSSFSRSCFTSGCPTCSMRRCSTCSPGESVYDPTCGSDGMVLSFIAHHRGRKREWRNVRLYGHERNLMTFSIARMREALSSAFLFRSPAHRSTGPTAIPSGLLERTRTCRGQSSAKWPHLRVREPQASRQQLRLHVWSLKPD